MGHRDAGGDRHLVDHVQQAALVGVARAALHPHAARQPRHRVAAPAHLHHADQRAQPDHRERDEGQQRVRQRRGDDEATREEIERQRHDQIHGEHDAGDGEREEGDEV